MFQGEGDDEKLRRVRSCGSMLGAVILRIRDGDGGDGECANRCECVDVDVARNRIALVGRSVGHAA